MSYESSDNLPLVNILVLPEMVLSEKVLSLLYEVTMKNTTVTFCWDFTNQKIVSMLYSLTIVSISKTWVSDISPKN